MKIVYLGIMAQRIVQMGGSLWSPQNLVDNMKANPQLGLMQHCLRKCWCSSSAVLLIDDW